MADSSKINPNAHVPRSQSVVERHITQAYVYGSRHQKKRIETYGRLNRQVLQQLVVKRD